MTSRVIDQPLWRMPSRGDQEARLKIIFRASPRNILPSLKKFLSSKPEIPSTCEPSMVTKLQRVFSEALIGSDAAAEHYVNARTVIQVIQYVASFPGNKGIIVLLDNGLLNMVSDAFVSSLHMLCDKRSDSAEKLYEEVLETIGAIADSGHEGRGAVVDSFCDRLLQVIISIKFSFSTKIETVKTSNMVLEGCPVAVREKLKNLTGHRELMCNLANAISEAGDYEFQAGITECLFRLTHKGDRADFAKKWFPHGQFLHNFLGIKDSDFETDCRKFLLAVNNCGNASVITIPARIVMLGKYKLKKPNDANYDAFWVDFNTGSGRLSLFCEPEPTESQEEDNLWETVSIWSENVVQYALQETEDTMEVIIELKCNAMDLIGFGPTFHSRTTTFHFDREYAVQKALVDTFGPEKIFNSKMRKTSVVARPIRVRSEEKELSESMATASSTTTDLKNKRQESVPSRPRVKVSMPCQPMRISSNYSIPVPDVISEATRQISPVKESRSVEEAVPKTPQQEHKEKKVKTPLQFVKPTIEDKNLHTVTAPQVKSTVHKASSHSKTSKKKSTKNMEEIIENVELNVIPSSCPGEDVMDLDLQQTMKATLPALSARKSQKHSVNDSGVCVDDTDDQIINKPMSKVELAGKTQAMAELKERLEVSDPDYCILPRNVHKVSTTPSLSTVSEESIAHSLRSKEHFKEIQSSIRTETIPEEVEFDVTVETIPEEPDLEEAVEICEELDFEEAAEMPEEPHFVKAAEIPACQEAAEDLSLSDKHGKTDNPEALKVQSFYRKPEQSTKRPRERRIIRKKNPAECVSPDSTSQCMRDASCDNIHLTISQTTDSNSNVYNHDIQTVPRETRNSRRKKDDTLPDTTSLLKKPRTRSKAAVKRYDITSSDVVLEIPETQPSASVSSDAVAHSPVDLEDLSQKLTSASNDNNKPDDPPDLVASALGDLQGIINDDAAIHDEVVPPQQPCSLAGQNEELHYSPKRKDQNPTYNWSDDDEFELLIEDSCSARRDHGDNINISEITVSPSIPKKASLLNCSQECQQSMQQKQPANRTKSLHNVCVRKPQQKMTTVNRVQPRKPETDVHDFSRKLEEKRNFTVTPKFFKSRLLNFENDKNLDKDDSTVFEFEPDLDLTQTPKNIKKQQRKGKNVKKRVRSGATQSTSTDNMLPQMVISKSNESIRPTRPKKKVDYKERCESEFGSELEYSIRSTPRAQKKSPTELGVRKAVAKDKVRSKKSIFSDVDEMTDSRSEVSWLALATSTARKRKPKEPKTYVHKTSKHGRLLTGSVYKKPDEYYLPQNEDAEAGILEDIPTRPAQPVKPKKKRKVEVATPLSDEDSPVENLYYKHGNKSTPNKENLNPFERFLSNSFGLAYPDLMMETPKRSSHSGCGSSSKKSRTPFKELTENLSIERFRFEELDMLAPPSSLGLDLSIMQECPRLTSSPALISEEKNLDQEDVSNDGLFDLGSQFSQISHISTLKTPKTPKNKELAKDSTDDDEEEELEEEVLYIHPSLLKSGPSKRNAPIEEDNISIGLCEEPEIEESTVAACLKPKTLFPNKLHVSVQEDEQIEEKDIEAEEETESTPKDDDGAAMDYNVHSGVSTLLQSFGSEIQNNLMAKKKQLEHMTNDLVKSSHKKLNTVWVEEYQLRAAVMSEFQTSLIEEVRNLEADMDQMKEAEDKILAFFKQQQAVLTKSRASQQKRLNKLMSMENTLGSKLTSQESVKKQQNLSRDILRSEMANLQRKIMYQTQQQEIMNVKKSLQAIFL